MSSVPLTLPPVYKKGKKVPFEQLVSQQTSPEPIVSGGVSLKQTLSKLAPLKPTPLKPALSKLAPLNTAPLKPTPSTPLNLKNLVNPQRPSIIGMFTNNMPNQHNVPNIPTEIPEKSFPEQNSAQNNTFGLEDAAEDNAEDNAEDAPESAPEHTAESADKSATENNAWFHPIMRKYTNINVYNGITLFADNKIEIRSSPESLSYTIIDPDQIRCIRIVGSKIWLAEKLLYGFSEIIYEYHQNEQKNCCDMLVLLRFIVFVKMQTSLNKFSAIYEKLFSSNIDDQFDAIKYTYPILCLYSYASTYEFYLCDASYDYEPSISIKIDNDIGISNVKDNQRITSRILIHYASYSLYLTCTNKPKKYIIETMNKLFQAVKNAQNNKHILDAIGVSKRIKIENYIKN